jgi:hypothetical protein
MPVMRVHKTKDYTVMSNTHFREREMSLKAKGLLSLMLSLPDTWDYSIAGLVAICKESETAINSTLKELKRFGYLQVTKLLPNQTESGRIEYVYEIDETPAEKQNLPIEKQGVENQGVVFQEVENVGQLNTNQSSTKKENTKKASTKEGIYITTSEGELLGSYKNIKIKETELAKLYEEYGEEETTAAIEYFSEYIELKGYKAKSHYLALRKWVFKAVKEERIKALELEQREKRAQEIGRKQALNELKEFYGSGIDLEDFNEAK